ncbi:MAG TPA: L-fucose:H+ symporter permease [Chitinophagaceae bacterium]|nr:L-fucose:H+ symporter permease [Chitinophagaceae bacterium]
MSLVPSTLANGPDQGRPSKYLVPLILVTSLFFLWGFSYGLVDSLNKHFQEVLHINKAESSLLQVAYFGGYFIMAIPAGTIMKTFGYKRGIILGLLLYACGAFLFYPSANLESFPFFLISLFVIACGLCCLETAANPYVTVLGSRETSSFRLNLSQSFNGVGSCLGPFLASFLFFGGKELKDSAQAGKELSSVKFVYLVIALVVLGVAGLFYRTPLPDINEEEQLAAQSQHHSRALFTNRHFVWAMAAQFFYVAAQVGVAAFFINYVTESNKGYSSKTAAILLGFSLVLFTIGRFAGTALMKIIRPQHLLKTYAIINIILCVFVIMDDGLFSVISLMIIFFFESIMFPTIFALGVMDLGKHTRRGGSLIIMTIAGGAFIPPIMGWIAQRDTTADAFIIPLVCFIVVMYFGIDGYRIRDTRVG